MVPVPKVSVVIPTRNRPVPLRNAVNSVLRRRSLILRLLWLRTERMAQMTPP